MLKKTTTLLAISLTSSLTAASFVYSAGDGLPLVGSTVITVSDGQAQSASIYGTPRETNTTLMNEHQTAIVIDSLTGNEVPFDGGYDPYFIDGRYGGAEQYRTVMTFDLRNIPLAPSGETYLLNDIELWLEVSMGGASVSSGMMEIYEGDFRTGALPTAIGSRDFSTNSVSSNSFHSFILNPTTYSPNNPDFFTITLASSTNTEIRFGSDYRQASSVTGTGFSTPSPFLIINAETVPIPEPSNFMLLIATSSLLVLKRKRKIVN